MRKGISPLLPAAGLCLLMLAALTQSGAQTAPAADLAEKRQTLAQELTDARRRLATSSEQERGRQRLPKEVRLLEEIDSLLERQSFQAQRSAELRASADQIDSARQQLNAESELGQAPAALADLEAIGNERLVEESRSGRLSAALRAGQLAVEDARQALSEREQSRRRIREALAAAGSANVEVHPDFRIARIEARAAQERLNLRLNEHLADTLDQEVHQLRIRYLTQRWNLVRARAVFSAQELEQKLEVVRQRSQQTQLSLEQAKLKLDPVEERLSRLRRAPKPAGVPDPVLAERIAAAQLERETLQVEIALQGDLLQQLPQEEALWQRRHALWNRQSSQDDHWKWEREAAAELQRLDSLSERRNQELEEIRKTLVALRARLESASQAGLADLAAAIQVQIDEARHQGRLYEAGVADLVALRGLYENFRDELGMAPVSWSQRWADFRQVLAAWWNFEITEVEDRPITISKVVIGLFLVVLGIFAARLFSRLVVRRFLRQVGLNEHAAAAIQSLVFYLLIVTVGLLALRLVNVPLTAFAILGGALAIGVGFGSQNIMNNFISGLILLAERPIRIGDLIQVDGLYGTVEHIGPRSTRVRSSENFDIIVPNSSFLEKNVVNWTLSDDRFRAALIVGVAYGSPAQEVADLLRQAVDAHEKVLKEPPPIILFADFGDNSLNFEAHFWIRMKRLMDRRMITSALRHEITQLFQQAGITIAFPQRDVHLDSLKPVEVRIVQDGEGSEAEVNRK